MRAPPGRAGRGRAVATCEAIERHGGRVIPVLLALGTGLAFLPTLGNGFVGDWDDTQNLIENPHYRGLGWPQVRWMFTTFLAGHYMPLTWLTLGLDHALWRMNPAGYHLTNLALHVASTMVFYAIARRLIGAAWTAASDGAGAMLGAALAAVLFAVHPLRVESVAWATERRDLLCGLLYLLGVRAYLRSCGETSARPFWRRGWYWAAVGLGALALLSKSMAVSLPLVLLVLDVYPLRRLGGRGRGWVGATARPVWAEKVPLVLLSGAASAVALMALAQAQGVRPIAELGPLDRAGISVYALAFYLWKMVVPVHLSPLYELPGRIDLLGWPYVTAALAVAGMSILAVLSRRRWPGVAAAWVSYVAILLPVLGIVQNGWQIAADRYTYLAGLGWALLVGAGLGAWGVSGDGSRGRARRAVVLAIATLSAAGILGALTWRQTRVWRDARSLWTHAVATAPSVTAHYNLGVLLFQQGDLPGAASHYRRALALKPDLPEAHSNLGVILVEQGRVDEAVRQYEAALKVAPTYPEAHFNLGLALLGQGRQHEAIPHLRQALTLRPDPETRRALDRALAESRLLRSSGAEGLPGR